jgi:capsular exopolysaccharide synthesis family protein
MTDKSLPAHLAPIRPPMPSPQSSPPIEDPKPFRARVVGTGLARYWKFVLPLWLIGSAAGMVLVHYKVKASYEAVSLVRIDPGLALFSSSGANNAALGQFLSTQVNLFKSNQVLKMALDEPDVKNLAMIRNADDPVILLRDALWLNVRPNTYLVDVGMRADSLTDAEMIIDSIVKNYIKYQESSNKKTSGRVLDNLDAYKKKLGERVDTLENEITATVDVHGYYSKGGSYQKSPRPRGDGEKGEPGDREADDPIKIREEEFRGVVLNCLQAEMRLSEAEAYLDQLKRRIEERQAFAMNGDMDLERQEHDLTALLEGDGELNAARTRREQALKHYSQTKKVVKKPGDPSLVRAYEQARLESERYDRLLQAKLQAKKAELGRARPSDDVSDAGRLNNAEDNVQKARAAYEAARRTMVAMKEEAQQQAKSTVRLDLRQSELTVLRDMVATLEREMHQKKFDLDTITEERVMVIDQARGAPVTDKRVRYMAMVPVLVLGLLVLGVVVVEVRAGRVTHPDDLATRLRTEVYTVPPLPTLRANALDDQRRLGRLEEFAQRMDHLRVALCGLSSHGGGRCVMITSAIGGEGKTTLAAQLAGRCANAGLSTLLIDADLRRPMLARLLEVPEQPGLAEILAGGVDPEATLVVIGNAGGFHLLPAGAPGPDPGRLFSGPNLGQLLQRLRAAFDVVIVDTPPVLPVPDALQLGRWVDGAVLAARHDSSRSHLIERANQLLTSTGVPLLGVVVNGVRSVESTYGGYGSYASYRSSAYRDGASTQR